MTVRSPSSKPQPAATVKKPSPPSKAAAAFAAVERLLADLDPNDLAVINIDIPQSVSIALGALPGLLPFREAIVDALKHFHIANLDHMETYALAAWYAHLLALPPQSPDNPVKPLLDEAVPLRENLLSDAEALARRGYLDAAVVAEIRAGHGNVDIANDLVALSALFALAWAQIHGRTAATEEEVKRAGDLGPQLLAALGVREHGAAVAPAEAADRRARAFTLFVRAWDELRRAITYLRWHEGDADQIAPSLYRGRGGRGSSASQQKDPDPSPPPVAAAPVAG